MHNLPINEVRRLQIENDVLKTDNAKSNQLVCELERKISLLENGLNFFKVHPKIAAGIKGEILIVKAVTGERTIRNASHDLNASRQEIKIEVKFSNANPVSSTNPSLRWSWNKVTGQQGKKQYDRLILVGEKLPNFIHQYKDPSCPYILYDIPFEGVFDLTTGGEKQKSRMIRFPIDLDSIYADGGKKCQKFETTIAELEAQYGL
ncbi:MAG TPA: hypothetical protein VF627_04400 [Abditibacterium sp.]